MGTTNFARLVNASAYYPVLMNYEQDIEDEDGNVIDTEVVAPEHWEYDELKENLADYIEENIKDYDTTRLYFNKSDNDRNRPTTKIVTVYQSKDYAGVEVDINLHVTITAGYYEGANLDFEVGLDDGSNEEVDNVDELVNWMEWYDLPEGMQVIQRNNVRKWINKELPKMKETVEKLLASFSGVKYELTAVFSNGEGVYTKVS